MTPYQAPQTTTTPARGRALWIDLLIAFVAFGMLPAFVQTPLDYAVGFVFGYLGLFDPYNYTNAQLAALLRLSDLLGKVVAFVVAAAILALLRWQNRRSMHA